MPNAKRARSPQQRPSQLQPVGIVSGMRIRIDIPMRNAHMAIGRSVPSLSRALSRAPTAGVDLLS